MHPPRSHADTDAVATARESLLGFTQFTVDQAKMAVFWCHSDGSFFYVNDTACEWLGYPRGELLKMHVADIDPEFPRESWDAHWQAVRAKGLLHLESVHQRQTDVIMPDRNGKVLFEELAARRPGLRVLFMSGYTDDVIAHHGVIDAGTRFLQKPFTAAMLATKIREALEDD